MQKEKVQVKVRQWLTRTDSNPLPCREMAGIVERETAKAILLNLHGFLAPTSSCIRCGRTLTHPVSLLYGIGPECGSHFHINPLASVGELEAVYEQMKRNMEAVTWKGWIPKSSIEYIKPYEEAAI
jgi:hypothetical protein